MALVRMIARPMMASMFLTGGVSSLKNSDHLVARAQPVLDRIQPMVDKSPVPFSLSGKQLVQLNGAVHVLAGAMLATGRAPRLAGAALAVSLVPTTFGGHRYWEETDPQSRANQRVQFFKNVSMLGGLLLASVDTEGKPSIAWRAKRQVGAARDQVSKLAPS